jgi:ribonuclease HI
MELLATVMALRNISGKGAVLIRTDSEYVANSFNSRATVRSNLALWRELDEAAAKRPIKVEWIKGHAGDAYNELVDKLARQAAKSIQNAGERTKRAA